MRPVRIAAPILMMLIAATVTKPTRADQDTFTKHVVVSQEANASDVGRDILRAGGNAIDAAVGTAFALAVTLPEAGNLGGGGYIVAYLSDRKEVVTVDFREMAPKASSARMYLDADGNPKPRYRTGAWAAGVPGTVRGLALAHARWGKRPWAELVRPSARLAREGFLISADLAGSLNRQIPNPTPTTRETRSRSDFGRLGDYPETVAALGKPDHTPWKAGDRLIQTDLAATLDRIATHGPDDFYTGQTAQLIALYMKEHGGFISLDDLRSYKAIVRPPVHTTFRGHDVYSIGPSSSGGIVLCQMLNILERFDLKADGRESPRTLHRVAEAMRRAFYTRATQLADPDFVPIDTGQLTSKAYADQLARTIDDHATPSASLASFPILDAERDHTTHFSTMDGAGNAVAMTYTLEDSYGAKCVVAGAGFLLNNEMGDFNLVPDRTDTHGSIGTVPNRIEPRSRMVSSQTPSLIMKDHRVRIVTGSPGGRTIPNTTLWVVLNLVEFGLAPRAAVEAPRSHHQWFPDVLTLEGRNWPKATRDGLVAMGHQLRTIDHQGNANTIVVTVENNPKPLIHGIADPRRSTTKASGD